MTIKSYTPESYMKEMRKKASDGYNSMLGKQSKGSLPKNKAKNAVADAAKKSENYLSGSNVPGTKMKDSVMKARNNYRKAMNKIK